jgi:hypothetical protein
MNFWEGFVAGALGASCWWAAMYALDALAERMRRRS